MTEPKIVYPKICHGLRRDGVRYVTCEHSEECLHYDTGTDSGRLVIMPPEAGVECDARED